MRQVVITGLGCAGPWGIAATPPARVEGSGAHRSALEAVPPGLSPRQRRYLGRNARLAIAACGRALQSASVPPRRWGLENLACWIATTRGATDPATTLEMIRAARRAGGSGPPLLRAALEVYNRRRVQVQYLLSMETAVAGHVTAAFGAQGPAHVITTAGAAGGAQALARAVRAVARGRVPAALACGVTTAEDPTSTAEIRRAARDPAAAVEGAGAVLVEPDDRHLAGGRTRYCGIRVVYEGFEKPVAGGAAAAAALWKIARGCVAPLPSTVTVRGFAGHRLVFELLPAGDRS